MSVAAVVTYRTPTTPEDDARPSYLPLATESEFRRYWRPLAERCGLEQVAQFGLGVTLEPQQFDDVLGELEVLARTAADEPPSPGSDKLRERARLLIELVRGLDRAEVIELFIG
jgi:hypothetical protein